MKVSITTCETVVLWLSFRAVENRDVFARAYMDVLTASLKDNHNITVNGSVHGLFEKLLSEHPNIVTLLRREHRLIPFSRPYPLTLRNRLCHDDQCR